MNIDQLTAKFAQAYTKRSAETYLGQPTAPMSSKAVTEAIGGAENVGPYLARSSPSGGGLFSDAGTPFQVQSGPTGVMSEAPELLARPIETQQSYGLGAFLDPTNPGFYSPYLDAPFVGADQTGFGLGGAAATSAGAYAGAKGFLNRHLFDPRSYLPGGPRTPANMTPAAADLLLLRSLGADPLAQATPVDGSKPLAAMQKGQSQPVSVNDMNPSELRANMAKQDMPGPGVRVPGLVSNAPVTIAATRPSGQTRLTLRPQTPLLRGQSRIPTAAGVRAALAPVNSTMGGVPTGPIGSFRSRAPMYAAIAGATAPLLYNAYSGMFSPEDPNAQLPFSGFMPRVGYNPAVLGPDSMLYENLPGVDTPVR